MEAFSETWVSGVLEREFIAAYLQSSLMTSMDGYSWTLDMDVSRKEVSAAYAQLREKYPVNEELVIIGGFSAGGSAALEAMLGNDIPLAGFAVLCPPPLESFTAGALGQAKGRGLRGTVMTTEMDPNVEAQRDMAALLESVDFPHQFVVTPDVGHWIPDDLPKMLDAAIHHIRDR
jgi:predicted esterase